jgi:hypothetical protein
MRRTRRSVKKNEIVPGPTVGGPSPADDDVPHIELTRGLTQHHFERGRERPPVALDRSRRRRPEDSATPQRRARRRGEA